MAKKIPTQKPIHPNPKPTSPRPWPDFPKQILITIGKHSTLMKNMSFGGGTKSWGLQKKNCNPNGKSCLPQLYENGDGDKYQMNPKRLDKFNISFHYGFYWWCCSRGPHPSQDPYLHFIAPIVGQSHGLVIVKSVEKTSEYYLRDPFRWSTRYLPDWDTNVPFKHVALSSNPKDHNYCVVLVITGIQHPAFVFCEFNRGKYVWTKKNSEMVDPYTSPYKQLMQFTSVIGYKGKFYALSLQGTLAVIEVSDSQLSITGLGSNRAIPSLPSVHFKEYLIESEGQILLLFLISRKKFKFVDDVEIYQLEFEKYSWLKMTGLGDRTLFVGKKCCIFVNASKVGCKGNCVYFTHQNNDDDWLVYDINRSNISPEWVYSDSSIKSPMI